MSSITTDRVVQGTLNELLVCQICLNVLVDPVEWEEWQISYCNKCSSEWIRRKKTENPEQEVSCPNRCKNFKPKPSHRVIKQELLKLLIKWGVSSKCMHRDSIDKILEHEKICDFNAVPWLNIDICRSLWRRNEVERHLDVCKFLVFLHDKCNLWNKQLVEEFYQNEANNPFLKFHLDYNCKKASLIDWLLWDTKDIIKAKFYDHVKNECKKV